MVAAGGYLDSARVLCKEDMCKATLHKARLTVLHIIGFGDDLGMQTSPKVSVDMYREYFKPRHEMMWKYVKNCPPHVKVASRCCGVYPLLPDLIDAGLDIIQLVQSTCKDMEIAKIKKEFGKDFVS